MALPIVLTTELDAVNEMLGAIGEMPVSSLDTVGNTDAAIAIKTLHGISREVQSKGWWFNQDDSYTFTLNAENKVPLVAQIIRVTPLGRGTVRITHRNNFLYDLSNRTDVFDPESPPVAKVTWFYEYELLPETARRYIAIRAARIFQKNVLGSEAQDHFTEEHESTTYALLASEQDDFEFAQCHNFINDDPDTSAIGNRS
ncbi:hypothetical protein [Lysobacter sp. Hz 25]|uniref:hypothetical protein n=1 Tax=Lysobacter sp. Hz 25 TaxID=3383698 RepID=UPI0038D47F4E